MKKLTAYIRIDGEPHNQLREVVLATEHEAAMRDALETVASNGAELGAAKAENERLRGLLTTLRVSLNLDDTEYGLSQQEKRALAAEIDAALPQQSEPTDTFTAVDMATAAAQGFRDGQAAVEQATAQDEREAFEAWLVANHHYQPYTLRTLRLGESYEGVSLPLAYSAWKSRPAQTEQQPVAYAVFAENGDVICFSIWREHPSLVALERNGHSVVTLAPIVQTAPQPDRSQAAELLREFVRLYGTDRDGWQIEDGLIGMARAYLAAQGGRHD